MKKRILLLLALIAFQSFYSQNSYVFFGSYNGDKSTDGIYVYQLDTIKGKLSKITSVKNVLNPSYLTLSNDGHFVYSCTDTRKANDGSVSSFKFNPKEKSLTFINSQKKKMEKIQLTFR